MKRNILLLANSSADSNAIVADAATRTGRGLQHINNSRHTFEVLMAGPDDIDLIIIDLDPGMHSMSVLEALGCCDTCPPIIVATGLEELEMTAIAHRHGATACIGKPFSAAKLALLMEEVCPPKRATAYDVVRSLGSYAQLRRRASSPATAIASRL